MVFLNILTPSSKKILSGDKVRTKIAKICIKTKWRLIESQYQRNMSQIVSSDTTFIKKNLQACASKITCLRATGSKCFRIVHFSHGRRDFQISLLSMCQGQIFRKSNTANLVSTQAYTLLSTKASLKVSRDHNVRILTLYTSHCLQVTPVRLSRSKS